ncbi:uncharacterized protein LOC116234828 [Phasianus colchicus]|uniref:uncharacterized protein LOC116234828 n=1 Tax=Phasianus colchicus TaxID=9054 RepID=UPI00129DADB0|nr:uncharacterized protein LOC116234828 [Phasianus colchicus]
MSNPAATCKLAPPIQVTGRIPRQCKVGRARRPKHGRGQTRREPQRQTTQNSPHSRRIAGVWSPESRERNYCLHDRRTGARKPSKASIATRKALGPAARPARAGFAGAFGAADLRAFPDGKEMLSPGTPRADTSTEKPPPSQTCAARGPRPAEPKHETRPRRSLRANFRFPGWPQRRGRRRGGAAAPAVAQGGGAQPSAARGAGGGSPPRPLSPLAPSRPRARAPAAASPAPGPRPPAGSGRRWDVAARPSQPGHLPTPSQSPAAGKGSGEGAAGPLPPQLRTRQRGGPRNG